MPTHAMATTACVSLRENFMARPLRFNVAGLAVTVWIPARRQPIGVWADTASIAGMLALHVEGDVDSEADRL
jgi:hypothetical protein